MNFDDLIIAAKRGDPVAFENIFNMYLPLMMKESILNGTFDEDLYQEQCIVLNRCITEIRV